jgi:potassium-transporting ATPase KdpC subunit
MNFARLVRTAVLMTMLLVVVVGVVYPLVVTGVAQVLFPDRANGQLIVRDGRVIGSRLIGQPFRTAGYFHSRPSAAGPLGYDASASAGSNLGPTSRTLVNAVGARVAAARQENPDDPVPIDLVTASGSGLDPDITPAAALFQVPRVARERGADEAAVRALVSAHVQGRQLGLLGEPRVNVLLLNLALDEQMPMRHR